MTEATSERRRERVRVRRRRRWRPRVTKVRLLVVFVLLLVGAYGAVQVGLAAREGHQGRRSLYLTGEYLGARQLDVARGHLDDAEASIDRADRHLRALGPLAWVVRVTPFARVQLRAVETYRDAGELLVQSGRRLMDAAEDVLEPPDGELAAADALDALRDVHAALHTGRQSLDAAAEKVESLDGLRLLGPLSTMRDQFVTQVPEIQQRAALADEGLGALIAFAGGEGPRRYLLLSQNPDEPRPTGGFVGSFGVLGTDGTHLDIERYDGIEAWKPPLPAPSVPVAEAPPPFRVPARPIPQTIHNVNATAHFPDAAELAMRFWAEAGEDPVDGVVSFAPEMLARVLNVLGPIEVPEYDDTVRAANLIERLDFHTHRPEVIGDPNRKAFLAVLSERVLEQLLGAPAATWEQVISAVGDAFDAREAMAWSTDPTVNRVLADRNWDGSVAPVLGDHLHLTEFAYTTKAGRGIRRTYDHQVRLRVDGSARITTTVTVANTLPASTTGKINIDTLSYLTMFGPQNGVPQWDATGAALDTTALRGHPGIGLVRAADPLSEISFTVTWEAPDIALPRRDGRREYRLRWVQLPGRKADTVRLSVELPDGWRWAGARPPAELKASARDVTGSWLIVGD